MNQIGLDIGNDTLKYVEVRPEKYGYSLVNVGKALSGKLGILADSQREKDTAKEYLTDFVVQNNLLGKYVNIAIPESLIFTRIITLPQLKGKELDNAVRIEAEQVSPIPLAEASMNFQQLPSMKPGDDKCEVLAVIAPKSLTKKLHELATGSGLRVKSIEPETSAICRGLISNKDNPPTLIINIGHTSSTIVVYSNDAVRLTRPFPTGFSSIVKAVSQELDLETVQAEEYVKTYGFLSDKLNGKIKQAINPIYAIILNEMKRAMTYFETRGYNESIKRVILSGGGALTPGIVVYTANFLNTEVQIADPWELYSDIGKYKDRTKELEDIAPLFSVASGLAQKQL